MERVQPRASEVAESYGGMWWGIHADKQLGGMFVVPEGLTGLHKGKAVREELAEQLKPCFLALEGLWGS